MLRYINYALHWIIIFVQPTTTGINVYKISQISPKVSFSSKWCQKLLPVPVLAADFDFVHRVCYYNVYFYSLEAIARPHERK